LTPTHPEREGEKVRKAEEKRKKGRRGEREREKRGLVNGGKNVGSKLGKAPAR
jgi:hypothetical protein